MRTNFTHLRHVLRAGRAFRQARDNDSLRQRISKIRTLPNKLWKGRRVYRIRCDADFGKGPHDVWITADNLLVLISLRRFRCPYHR